MGSGFNLMPTTSVDGRIPGYVRRSPTDLGLLEVLIAELGCGLPNQGSNVLTRASHFVVAATLLTLSCASQERARVNSPEFLFVWAGDSAQTSDDFLAVIDLRRDSPRYAQVIATAPAGARKTFPHHTEHEMPRGNVLWANGYGGNQSFRFDLIDPEKPRVVGTLAAAESLSHAHSFARLTNGNVLMTFQASASDHHRPGGVAEFDSGGRFLRWASAADATAKDYIRPYSLTLVPALDRFVTTSADMEGSPPSSVVQVWRLSDLKLLASVRLPPGPRGSEGIDPAEPRVLSDGRTVLVSTFNCGLYELHDVATDAPRAELIHDFTGGDCALAVVIGNYWIATVPAAQSLVVLDVSQPSSPREVSRLTLENGAEPHWIAADTASGYVVITGKNALRHRVLLAKLDRATGAIALDSTFRDAGSAEPGITFARKTWPHGASGTAVPHGAVFSRASGKQD
jgi:hypothetical protein